MPKQFAIAACLAGLMPLWASVDGTVVNATTGRPLGSTSVSLVQPGQNGMQPLGEASSGPDGKFRFDQAVQNGPVLLQVTYKGVTYNRMLPPGTPTSGIDLEVYDSSSDSAIAKASRDMILLEPTAGELLVSETVLLENGGKVTYNDPSNGTFRFYMPEAGAAKVQVNCSGPQGMPLPRKAEKTNQAGIYKVNFPVKPGETRFDITYSLPATTKFSGRIVQKEGTANLVSPRGVTLEGDSVQAVGQEPNTQATVYSIKGREFAVNIEGTGSLRGAEPSQAAAGEDNGPPPIKSAPPRLYDQLYAILGLTAAILLLGFVLLYRSK